ncbi:hypothetical protein KKC13_12375 [bacterium]|nr:hypothetical protein [bacterium]MBU1958754.1 hypothetical protein [bacterium]
MRTLRVEVSDTIYEHIIFFLKSLPKNLINISDDREHKVDNKNSIKNQVEELFSTYKINSFQDIKDPIAWQKSMRDEWE